MTKSHSRGHEIYYDGTTWRYTDTGAIYDDSRPCARCGKYPTKEGYDACIGKIDSAIACCCGHGTEKAYINSNLLNKERGICWPAIRTSFHKKMSDYEWLTEMGLCHKCRKNKVVHGKKFCFDCLEKTRLLNAKNYDPEKAKAYQGRRREIYKQKKQNGICVRCNRAATHGMYCYECYLKYKKNRKRRLEQDKLSRHDRGLIPEKRKEESLCLWCGEPAMRGKNCCEKHSNIFSEAGKKAADKDEGVSNYWKMQKSKNSDII